ncbi:MAG: S8 family serine peptidase, partial [Acidobacteriota bacterium]|nr:S8 family serine peptidase [Acidobacteriota bacterium]
MVDVIVQFKGQLNASHHQIVASVGGTLKKELPSANAAMYSVPQAALTKLNANGNVAFISSNRIIHPTLDYASAAISAGYAQQLQLHGENVGVAVIDSGISATASDLHYGFPWAASGVVYSESFVPGKLMATDDYGHGTHVAGILAGDGSASKGSQYTHTLTGIAPKVKIINLRVLDATGAGTDSQVIAAIDRAIELKNIFNIRVINLSVGRPVFESYTKDPLCHAVERAWAKGIVVVVAAGNYGRNNFAKNNGYGTITAPGNDPMVITVGAMKTQSTVATSDDYIASYSSKGPSLFDHIVKPDLVAPGNKIISAKASGSALANGITYPDSEVLDSYYMRKGDNDFSADYLR